MQKFFALAVVSAVAARNWDDVAPCSVEKVNGKCPDDPYKAFGGQIGNTINSMNEYGCWCYFNDDHGRGKGTPVDAIDEMCKTLHDGYECAMRDAEEEGTTCPMGS